MIAGLRPARPRQVIALLVLAPLVAAAYATPAAAGDGVGVHECTPTGTVACVGGYVEPGHPGAGVEVTLPSVALEGNGHASALVVHDGALALLIRDGRFFTSADGREWVEGPRVPAGLALTLATFQGELYASESNCYGKSPVWRLGSGGWSLAFAVPEAGACHVYGMHGFEGDLYAGTSGSRIYAWDGAAVRQVLDIGLGTQAYVGGLEDDGHRVYASTGAGTGSFGRTGIWVQEEGSWSQVVGTTTWARSDVAAGNGRAFAVNGGPTLYDVTGGAAKEVATFDGLRLTAVATAHDQFVAFAADDEAGVTRVIRHDGVGATTLGTWTGGHGQAGSQSATLDHTFFAIEQLGRGGFRLHAYEFLVDVRPVTST